MTLVKTMVLKDHGVSLVLTINKRVHAYNHRKPWLVGTYHINLGPFKSVCFHWTLLKRSVCVGRLTVLAGMLCEGWRECGQLRSDTRQHSALLAAET
jgi:hypothetical protein